MNEILQHIKIGVSLYSYADSYWDKYKRKFKFKKKIKPASLSRVTKR